jgi:transposase
MEISPELTRTLPPEVLKLIQDLMARVSTLEAENAELKRRLGMNSKNSSKPPSSDALTKANPPERDSKPKPRGGRPGKTRHDFGTPDKTEELRATHCPDCNVSLEAAGKLVDRRQVAELVEKPFIITEYLAFEQTCSCCGKVIPPPIPDDVLPGFNLPISEGTLNNANLWLHAALAAPVAELKEILPAQPHVHGDETGWNIDGFKHWVWTVSTETFTYLTIAKSRGSKVLVGLLSTAFAGLISCDFWSAYRSKEGVGGERAYCWAHLLREAQALIDHGDAIQAEFGLNLRRLLKRGFRHWRYFKRERIGSPLFLRLGDRLKAEVGILTLVYDGKMTKKGAALRRRLVENLEGYFNWYRFEVPPENNLAERALRPVVVNRKVSGGSRSQWGAELTAFMQTVIGTCRKQGRHVLSTLRAYLLALAHPGLSYPSLVPGA